MTPVRARPGRNFLAAAAAAAIVLACLAVNLWYFRAETHPPTFDDAWYLENSCRFYYALRDEGPASFYRAYAASFKFKAPLISVLPLPAYALFGPSHDSALWVNLAATLMLCLYLFLLGKRLFSETAGLLAVAIITTLPLIAGLTHRFYPAIPLCAVVAGTLYHLSASEELKRSAHVHAIGILTGVGLLLKSLYPIFVAGAVLDMLWRCRRKLGKSFFHALEPPFKTIIVWSGLLSLTWYANNLLYAVGYIFRASIGDVAAHYTYTNVSKIGYVLTYLDAFIEGGISYYYFLAAGGIAAALFRKRKRYESLGRFWSENPALGILLPSFAIPVLLGALGKNNAIRLLTPALPAFALLLAGGLDKVTERVRRRAPVLAAFFIIPLAGYCLQTFGVSLLPAVEIGPISFLKRWSTYSGSPQTSGQWRQQELVDWIQRETAGADAVVAVGTEVGYLNANNLNYFSACRNYRIRFVNYGYEESRIERTVARLIDKGADYLLVVDGIQPELHATHVLHLESQIRALIRQGRLPFAPGPAFALTDEITANLYRKTGRLRHFGAPAPSPSE